MKPQTVHSSILYSFPTSLPHSLVILDRHQACTVSLEWLAESIAKKTVCDAEPYIVRLNSGKPEEEIDAAPSPASKQNILSMSSIGRQANRKRLNFDDAQSKATIQQTVDNHLENLLIDEYANAQPSQPKAIEDPPSVADASNKSADLFKVPLAAEPLNRTVDSHFESEYESTMSEPATFLTNMKVYIYGFDDESTESLVEDCELAGGKVIQDANSTEAVDYLILPLDAMTMHDIKVEPKHIVNHNWLVGIEQAKHYLSLSLF